MATKQEDPMTTPFDEMTGGETALVPAGQVDVEMREEGGQPETEVSISGRSYATAADFSSDEVAVPRLRLAQGLTQEVQNQMAHPGQWVLTGYDAEDEVRIAPVMFSRARALRDKELNVLCSSKDAKTGTGDPGGSCESCPMAKWTEAVSTGKNQPPKNDPPRCDLIYSYLCWSFTHETLIAVEFKKTSINVGKTLNTLIATKGLGNFAVRLSSSRQQNSRGSFFVAQVVNSPMTDEDHSTVVSVVPEF